MLEPIGQPDLAHRVCDFESVNHPLTESGSFAARDNCGYSELDMNDPAT